ncbi:hypothetical protein VTK26DRAFT_4235 [Humicola hyalothermophila]
MLHGCMQIHSQLRQLLPYTPSLPETGHSQMNPANPSASFLKPCLPPRTRRRRDSRRGRRRRWCRGRQQVG